MHVKHNLELWTYLMLRNIMINKANNTEEQLDEHLAGVQDTFPMKCLIYVSDFSCKINSLVFSRTASTVRSFTDGTQAPVLVRGSTQTELFSLW